MDIPNDIRDTAKMVRTEVLLSGKERENGVCDWEPIARAILAERERCAKIAEAECLAFYDEYATCMWEGLGRAVARAIRTPTGEEQ